MAFHLYDISEIYSNPDGSVQFVELRVGGFNGENLWAGHALTVSQGGSTHSFTFATNLPSSQTANTTVLVATAGFAAVAGVTPDYVIPAGFLFTGGGTLDFAGVDSVSYVGLPTDGRSVDRSGTAGIATPRNFAGQQGSIAAGPPTIDGTPGNDTLTGTAQAEVLHGLAGNDTLTGGGGNDTLDGSTGLDTAAFGGNRAAYAIAAGGGSITGPDGTDTLVGIERLRFGDRAVAFDLDGAAGRTAKLLGAVFGAEVLASLEVRGIGIALFDGGLTYEQVAQLAVDVRLGASHTNADLVRLLYASLTGSAPDDATTAIFVGLLERGEFTQASLTVAAAELSINADHVGLAGLTADGMDFIPA